MSNEVSEVTLSVKLFILHVNSLQGDSPGVFETISGGPQIQNYFIIILKHYLQFLLIMFSEYRVVFSGAT